MDFDRVRLLWPDHLGLARGKYLPAATAEAGTAHCLALFALDYDREMDVEAPGPRVLQGLPDLDATFDPDTLRAGWEPDTAVAVADISFEGEDLPFGPRPAAKRAIQAWRDLGWEPKLGIELEAYVMEPDPDGGGWRRVETPGHYVYATGPAGDPTGLIDEVMATADRVGLPLESVNTEYDAGQFELTLRYDDALRALDDAFLFKVMARELAMRRGLMLTFLGKPINGAGGSGLHLNLSLSDDDGTNAMADPDGQHGLSDLARQCLAGMLAHHEGMTALCCPTVNAYKRIRPAEFIPYWANWGLDHRGTTIRVPPHRGAATRLEHRLSDGAANPYTAAAAVLHAARLGVVDDLECPDAETGNCLDEVNTDRHVPESLGEALEALQADTALCDAMGDGFIDHFVHLKTTEWKKFMTHVTDWELDHYLPFH
ncbi:glutamine synthetase family protein [Salsipaludibacter albus]|uniref:glutamine synthetase family protein n=1 Tax=Salsipaludibacter albus TaxID=2849650 RepID=UPI001EE43A29|nr:glutamine synthetase family protein [Salsipaludibacter albus]MBY5162984.1 glutamine synthetase family protein [Salsipaludibacter albus]